MDDDVSDKIIVGGSMIATVLGCVIGWFSVFCVLFGFTHSKMAYSGSRTWIDYAICAVICFLAYKLGRWVGEHVIIIPVFIGLLLRKLFSRE